ncbi:MAG TPA: hypothetical protein VFI06_09295 [Chitinophagaceae bacterium]|nr:hypothetical protein [Chitinophagaceae bacterium]
MQQQPASIPENYKGAQSATTYSVKVADSAGADWLFEKAKRNLLDVNRWHQLAGSSTARFKVIDENNRETNEPAKEGNYLRINIPVVPKTGAGHGFDWVRVEKIEEIREAGYRFIGMLVRPCHPPFEKQEVAHFFSPHATSTFCVERKGKKIKAAVYGRNENPNTRVHTILARLRNMLIALGAMIGLNKPQWRSLVKGWLRHTSPSFSPLRTAEETQRAAE